MTQQIVDNTPGAGEAAQTAFAKVNANFSELYGPTGTAGALTVLQPTSGLQFAPGAKINRQNDRVFIGGAALNDGLFPPASVDWLSAYEDMQGYTNFTMYGKLSVLTDTNSQDTVGITVGAQSLHCTSAAPSIIGIESWAISNSPTFGNQAWAYYGEAHKRHATGLVYGMELDIHTGFLSINPTPYQQGDTIGLQLADGAGVGGANFTGSVSGNTLTVANSPFALQPQLGFQIGIGNQLFGAGIPLGTHIIGLGTGTGGLGTYIISASLGTISAAYMSVSNDFAASAALQVQNNIVPWVAGFVFGQYSLAGCDGVTGNAVAIGLAKGHLLQWYNNTGSATGLITSSVATASNGTKITFTDSGLQIAGIGGGALAYFAPVASAVNNLSFTAGATTVSPIIQATGSDNNVDLDLRPGGAVGTAAYIKFGSANSFVANSTNTVTVSAVGPSTLTSATIGKWWKIKDNAGNIWGIPLWPLSS